MAIVHLGSLELGAGLAATVLLLVTVAEVFLARMLASLQGQCLLLGLVDVSAKALEAAEKFMGGNFLKATTRQGSDRVTFGGRRMRLMGLPAERQVVYLDFNFRFQALIALCSGALRAEWKAAVVAAGLK